MKTPHRPPGAPSGARCRVGRPGRHRDALAAAATPHEARCRRPAAPTKRNAVVHWNTVAGEAFAPSQGTNPMAQSRTFAILHAAIHDALNAIDRRYESYTPGLARGAAAPRPRRPWPRRRARCWSRCVPDQAALVETAYGRALVTVRDGAGQDRRHRHRAGRRLGDDEPPARRRRRHRRAAGATCRARSRRVPVHRAVRLRGAARLGPRAALRHRPARARARRAAGADQRAVRARPGVRQGDRPRRQHDAHAPSNRRSRSSGTRIRRSAGTASPTPSCASAASTPGRRRARSRCVHFAMADGFIAGFDEKYRVSLLAPGDRDPRGGHRRQPADRSRPGMAAVPGDAAGARLPVHAHGAGLGRGRGADRAVRRQGALQHDQPDAAGRDAPLPRASRRRPRRTGCRACTPASTSGTP